MGVDWSYSVSAVSYLAKILKSRRIWGLAGTAIVLYLLTFVIFGKLNVSGIMPDTNQIARTIITVWPRMPFFTVQKESVSDGSADGRGQYIYYTVPTRQLTPQELAQMGVTNSVAHPAMPK